MSRKKNPRERKKSAFEDGGKMKLMSKRKRPRISTRNYDQFIEEDVFQDEEQ